MTTNDDTTDLRFLAWKETTTSALIDRVKHLDIARQIRQWLIGFHALDAPECVAVIALLGAELNNLLHQELSADHPELSETLRFLSLDEALRAVYTATH